MRGRWQAAGLLACLLLLAVPLGRAADDLKGKLAEAQEAQEMGEEVAQPVKAKIVKEAPEAVLASGTGDVATTGTLACVSRPCSAAPLWRQTRAFHLCVWLCLTEHHQPPSRCFTGKRCP